MTLPPDEPHDHDTYATHDRWSGYEELFRPLPPRRVSALGLVVLYGGSAAATVFLLAFAWYLL